MSSPYAKKRGRPRLAEQRRRQAELRNDFPLRFMPLKLLARRIHAGRYTRPGPMQSVRVVPACDGLQDPFEWQVQLFEAEQLPTCAKCLRKLGLP